VVVDILNSYNTSNQYPSKNSGGSVRPCDARLFSGTHIFQGINARLRKSDLIKKVENIGFLHTPVQGRESFAIDLIELLRAGADAFVITLLDNRMFDENEFSTSKEFGCL